MVRAVNVKLILLSSRFSFNAAPGTGAAMRSLAARLSIMTHEERTELKSEIRECLGPIGLNLKTLHKMKKLDNLVCEVNANFNSDLSFGLFGLCLAYLRTV